jgi:hypothetical protein
MERGDFAVGSVPDRGITPGSLENAEAVYFRIVWTVYSESSDSCLQRITLTLVAWCCNLRERDGSENVGARGS